MAADGKRKTTGALGIVLALALTVLVNFLAFFFFDAKGGPRRRKKKEG